MINNSNTNDKLIDDDNVAFESVCVVLIIVRRSDGRFLCTNEKKGWFLPAGIAIGAMCSKNIRN
jgi:hypothetical protein